MSDNERKRDNQKAIDEYWAKLEREDHYKKPDPNRQNRRSRHRGASMGNWSTDRWAQ